MNRIPCGALQQLPVAERDAVEEQIAISLTDLGDAIQDAHDMYVALHGTLDYVLSGKKSRAALASGLDDLDD